MVLPDCIAAYPSTLALYNGETVLSQYDRDVAFCIDLYVIVGWYRGIRAFRDYLVQDGRTDDQNYTAKVAKAAREWLRRNPDYVPEIAGS